MGMRLSDRRKSMYKVMETGSDDGGLIEERLSAFNFQKVFIVIQTPAKV